MTTAQLLTDLKGVELAYDTPVNRRRLLGAATDLLEMFAKNVGPDFFGEIGLDLVVANGTIQRAQLKVRRDRIV